MPTTAINITNAGGDNFVIAAPTGASQFIRVYQISMVPSAACTITVYGGTHGSGTPLDGPFAAGANIQYYEDDWQTTWDLPVNTGLNIYTGDTTQIGGSVTYRIFNG